MKYSTVLFLLFISAHLFSQDTIYMDHFDSDVFSVGDNPSGYSMGLNDGNFRITGTGTAGPWTAMSYFMHDGSGTQVNIDISSSPKLYIKAKGDNQPSLRIDFQDVVGYVTNQNPVQMTLDDDYEVYEYDLTGRLNDGAYGGPCTSAPCPLDATQIQGIILFVNAPNGGYSGNIDIDWISVGAPLEDLEGSGSSRMEIRYNQVSYLTGRDKIVSVVSGESFENVEYKVSREGESNTILEGVVSGSNLWQPSREYVGKIDLTEIDQPGEYVLQVGEETEAITVSEDGYKDLCEASIKYYYFNRASQELTEEFAGPWARPLGHPDNVVIVHPSAASAGRPSGTTFSSPKGWYDAGDYNKYIVNSGISTYTLLAAYEHYPEYYKSLQISIPEKGGEIPDLLDEVKWNLDWMLTMQDPGDGGVYHKLTGLNFSGIVMPHQYNFDRYVVQKTTAAALNFAAVCATASRIFEEFESSLPGYADELLQAASQAYDWAKANPTIYYQQPSNVNTGQYGDGNVKDEFDWAAAELLISTGEAKYANDLNVNSISDGVPAWPYTAPLALISLAHHGDELPASIDVDVVKNKLLSTADELKSKVVNSEMNVAMGNGDFFWGSNGHAGNQVMMLIRAYEVSGDESYLDAAFTGMDYLLGRNGTGFCYVSGFGDKSPRRPHHRPSEADNVGDPVPGMVAGGPNPGQQDGCSGYPNNFPASSYVDSWCSYASNEVTINWNAPLVYAVNALQFYQVGVSSSTEELDSRLKQLEIFPNPGSSILSLKNVDTNGRGNMRIFNNEGKVVFHLKAVSSNQIDVSTLGSGVYYVTWSEGKEVKTAKWVKIGTE